MAGSSSPSLSRSHHSSSSGISASRYADIEEENHSEEIIGSLEMLETKVKTQA